LSCRQVLAYLMNQQSISQGPLRGYGLYTVGPVGTHPTTQFLSAQGKQGDAFPYNPTKATDLLTSHGRKAGPGAQLPPAVRDGDRLDRVGDDPAAVQREHARHQDQPRAQAVQPGD